MYAFEHKKRCIPLIRKGKTRGFYPKDVVVSVRTVDLEKRTIQYHVHKFPSLSHNNSICVSDRPFSPPAKKTFDNPTMVSYGNIM